MLGTPNRDRVSERREATRQEILEAAWSLAREVGLANLTLRDIAQRVGMQPPSLYSHFESKNAIYDAMFGQAWTDVEAHELTYLENLPAHPRAAVKGLGRLWFDYAVQDLARHQLMNQRTIPGFVPSPESYAPAVRVLERSVTILADLGVTDRGYFDIWVSLLGGLVDQQLANDPGGDRFSLLLEPATDMWADAVGIPKEATSNGQVGRKAGQKK
jgi:AcrR family transcriptional regulator